MYREAADFGEDGFGGFGPHEGLWFIVVLLDVAVDGALEIGDRAEGAALEPAAGQRGEEALDGVQPGAGCRCEVEGPACMPAQPGDRFGVLVGAVVVEDRMDGLAGRDLPFDGIEETDELLVPLALHAAADHSAVENVERGEQAGGAVALVVVGPRFRDSDWEWAIWEWTIE